MEGQGAYTSLNYSSSRLRKVDDRDKKSSMLVSICLFFVCILYIGNKLFPDVHEKKSSHLRHLQLIKGSLNPKLVTSDTEYQELSGSLTISNTTALNSFHQTPINLPDFQPKSLQMLSNQNKKNRVLKSSDKNKDEGEMVEEEEEAAIEAYVSFFLCSLLCAAALQWLVSHITVYSIPVSIIWFIFGMVMALIVAKLPSSTKNGDYLLISGIHSVGKMNAEIVYSVLLPILLYESAVNCDWHRFKRFFISGVTLAVLGVAYQVGVVGLLMHLTLPSGEQLPARISWYNAFLIASSLASTDPVAVTSVLNSLQAPPKLASMLEGESLINDGSSVLLFQFFKSLSRGDAETWRAIVARFILLLFVGPIWGLAVGFAVYLWLRKFRRYPDMQILVLMSAAYAVFFVGEKFLKTSGPVSIVCFGLYYNAFCHIVLDNEAQMQHHHSVKALSGLANSSIFIISGVVAMRMIFEAITLDNGLTEVQVWNVGVLYLYLLIARVSMLIVFLPVLRRTGYGVNWKEVVLLIWGGLRGAIVLAMGLMIEQDHHILEILRYQAVLYIAGSTFLILLINGVTFELLYKLLNPYPPKPFRRVYLERVMKMIDYQYLEERRVLEDHWLFRGTGILYYADKSVPVLGWRKMDRRGKIDFKLPSLALAFHELPSCDTWIPPNLMIQKFDEDISLHLDSKNVDDEEFLPSLELPISGAPIPPPTAGSDGSPYGDSPLLKIGGFEGVKSLERLHEEHEAHEDHEDAEQRAHAATVALLGLRDARPCLNTFDAKYYLRLVEHVTDENLQEKDKLICEDITPTVTIKDSATTAVKSRRVSQEREHPNQLEDNEVEDGTELQRYDTDRTIIFPSFQDLKQDIRKQSSDYCSSESRERSRTFSQSPLEHGELKRHSSFNYRSHLPSDPSNTFLPALRHTESSSLGIDSDGAFHRKPRFMSFNNNSGARKDYRTTNSQKVSNNDKTSNNEGNTNFPLYIPSYDHTAFPPDDSDKMPEVSQRKRFSKGYNESLSSKEKGSSSLSRKHLAANEIAIPSASSEPYGSARLDSAGLDFARLDVGRMTRLRNPEWDRRPQTPLLQHRSLLFQGKSTGSNLTTSLPSSTQENLADELVPYLGPELKHSAFDRPPPTVRRVSASSITMHSEVLSLSPETRHNKIHFHHIRDRRRSHQAHKSPELRNNKRKRSVLFSRPFQGDQNKSDAMSKRKRRLLASLKHSGLPNRVVSAPIGQLDIGNLGFDSVSVHGGSSIGSSEEYLEIPETPHRGSEEGKSASRVKILRKEREGELYIMVFNAIRQMYRRLYAQHFIGGSAMLSLGAVLDHSTDFAIGKLKKNPIKAWKDVLEGVPYEINNELLYDEVVTVTEGMTGFEFEWRALACRLRCVRARWTLSRWLAKRFPENSWIRATLTFSLAMADLEQVTAFVDVHEELLFKGGPSLEQLLGPKLLKQVYKAKRFILMLRSSYPESYPYTLAVHAATLLVNLKQQLIEEQAQKGLILDEDSKYLNSLFEEHHQNLSSFRPVHLSCFGWLKLKCLCPPCLKKKSRKLEDVSSQPQVDDELPGDTKSTGDECGMELEDSASTRANGKENNDAA